MNKIKLNNLELEVEDYSKNTYFNGNIVECTGSCNVITNNVPAVIALGDAPITSIKIYHDETLIYSLEDTNVTVSSVSEYLDNGRMRVGMNFIFPIT